MNYCERCNFATGQTVCPRCGNKRVRPVREDDFCFLAASKSGSCDGLVAAFEEEGVPFSAMPSGSGVETQFGLPLSDYKLFVPVSSLETAKSIMAEMERAETDDLRNELLENIESLNWPRKVEKKARKKLRLAEERSFADYCLEVIKSAEKISDGGAVSYNSTRNGSYLFCYSGNVTMAVNSKTFEVLSVSVNKNK